MESKYRALGWVGGKSSHSASGTCRWICGLLPPPSARFGYVEAFAGMAGILLNRLPAQREILNDLDTDLINWWMVVRDYPHQLAELLDWTPSWSADLFREAVENLKCEDAIRRAYYFTLAMSWVRGGMIGRVRGNYEKNPDTAITRAKITNEQSRPLSVVEIPQNGYIYRKPPASHRTLRKPGTVYRGAEVMMLTERLKMVELEIRPAEWMVEYYGENNNYVFYLDPPYQVAEQATLYSYNRFDIDEWIPRVLSIRGLCAISGYGEEWDALLEEGWHRFEHKTLSWAASQKEDVPRPERVEVLWTNYNPEMFHPQQSLW